MLQIRRCSDFPSETVDAERFRELRPKDLDGDGPVVPEVSGEINCRGPAFAELALDAIAVL